jgi:hypothetical protein
MALPFPTRLLNRTAFRFPERKGRGAKKKRETVGRNNMEKRGNGSRNVLIWFSFTLIIHNENTSFVLNP